MKYFPALCLLAASASAQSLYQNTALTVEGPINYCGPDSGTANAYVCANARGTTIALYRPGVFYSFKATHANSGAATLAIDGNTPVPIKKQGSSADLTANDIAVNSVAFVIYDGAQFELLNPATAPGGAGANPSGTMTVTPGTLANGAGLTLTPNMTLTGAAMGTPLVVSANPVLPLGVLARAQVIAANSAQVQLVNLSGASVTVPSTVFSAVTVPVVNPSGTVTAPAAGLSPTSLTFGNQTVGTTSAAQTVTLTNSGTAALTISNIQASGDYAETNTCGGSLAVNASCTVSVTLTPTVAGTRTGALTFTDNAGGSPQSVSLTGTGTVAFASVNSAHQGLGASGSNALALTWSPAAGNVLVVGIDCWGNTTACGMGSLTDSKGNTYAQLVTGTHGPSVFSALYCASVTTGGSGITVTAAFANQATGGDSDLTVAEYAGVSCTLDGTAAANDGGTLGTAFSAGPVATANAKDLILGYATATAGTSPTAGTGFTARQNVPNAAEIYIFEDEAVTSTGSYTATAANSQATTWSMIEAALHITGSLTSAPAVSLSPASVSFGNQTVNTTSAAQTVTLTNTGNAALTISNVAVTGNFAQTNTCGTSLAAHAACTISLTFTPASIASLTGTLTLTDNAAGSPQSVPLSGTGIAAAATFAYINSAHQGLGAAGSNALALSWSPASGHTLVVGVDCWGNTTACAVGSITDSGGNTYTSLATTTHGPGVISAVYCAPVTTGGPGMTVTAAFSSQATGGDSDLTVTEYSGLSCTLDGTATGTDGGTPSATLSAGPLTTTNAKDLLVGYGTASVGNPPTAGSGFAVRQNTAGGEVYVYEDEVVSATGSYPAAATTSQATSWGMIEAALKVTGTIPSAPIASFSPSSLSFASQTVSTTSSAQTVTLSNTGTAALTISGLSTTGNFAQTNTCGGTLAVSASCTISVTFTPTSTGALSGSVTVTDNAAGSPQTIALSGTGASAGGGGSAGAGGTNSPDSNAVALSTVSGCSSAGTGGNDTTCLQNAMSQSASGGKQVIIPAGTFNVDPLTVPSNTNLFLSSGTTLYATSGYGGSTAMLTASGSSNIKIKGYSAANSIVHMRKAEYTDGSEYRHCLVLSGVNGATMNGWSCNDSGGDGMYINNASTGVTVQNMIFNNNSRNGISIISTTGATIDHVTVTNTLGNPNGGSGPNGPWDGIDIEPNGTTDHVQNLTISNSVMSYNGNPCPTGDTCAGGGHGGNGVNYLLDHLGGQAVSITINNVQTDHNLGSGFYGSANPPSGVLTGSLLIENSSSTLDGQQGIGAAWWDYNSGGITFTAQNDTVTNPQQGWSGAPSIGDGAFGVHGGDSGFTTGNITVTGLSVNWTGGTYAFWISPSNPMHTISVSGMGTVTGISSPVGYLTGTGRVNSVSIP